MAELGTITDSKLTALSFGYWGSQTPLPFRARVADVNQRSQPRGDARPGIWEGAKLGYAQLAKPKLSTRDPGSPWWRRAGAFPP